MHPFTEARFGGRVHDALDDVGVGKSGHFATVGRKVERRCFKQRTGNEHMGIVDDRVHSPHHQVISAQSPMLRAPQFDQFLHPPPAPCCHIRQAQPTKNDPVHLGAEQELGEPELLLRVQYPHGLVRNGEKHAARHRLLVILDLSLEVQLVLVLERSGLPLRHAERGWGRV